MTLRRSFPLLLSLVASAAALGCAADATPPSDSLSGAQGAPESEGTPEAPPPAAPAAPRTQLVHTAMGARVIKYQPISDYEALVEGDIRVPIDANGMVVESSLKGSPWPGGNVPYQIDSTMAQADKTAIQQAIAQYTQNTNVHLTVRNQETDYIRFVAASLGAACGNSPFGKQGGAQTIQFAPGCGFSTAVHELGHSLGLAHEQSRNDRDLWVLVNQANSNDGNFANDYGIVNGTDNGMYDFSSIMQYWSCSSFAKFADCFNAPSSTQPDHRDIEKKNLDLIYRQTFGLSAGDISGLRVLYGGSSHPFGFWGGIASTGDAAGAVSDLAVGLNTSAQIEVFAHTADGSLVHERNGGQFETLASITSAPAVALNRDRALEVFARGADGTLGHAFQDPSSLAMSGWYSLGLPIKGAPAVGMNTDGNLEVFAIGTDNNLYHVFATGDRANPWSSPYILGSGPFVGTPAVANNQDGRLEVFVRTLGNGMQHVWATRDRNTPWSGMNDMGISITSDPSVALNPDGRLEVFARGTDGSVIHAWQTWQGPSGFSTAYSLGESLMDGQKPVVAVNGDGGIQVFALRSDGMLRMNYQTFKASAPWGGWSDFGSAQTIPGIGRTFNGRLDVYVGFSTSIFHRSQ